MTLLDKYRALVANGVIAADPAQAAAAAGSMSSRAGLRRWRRREGLAALLRGSEPAPKGLYIFGPVGRGKTMLMDLFFQATTFRPKRRVHFHEFMAEVHDRIAEARKDVPGDPIPHVAQALAAKARADLLRRAARHRHRRCHDPRPPVQGRCSRRRWWWWPPPTCPRRALQERPQPRAVPALHRSHRAAHGRRGAAGGQGLPAREAGGQAALLHAGGRARQGRDGPAVDAS